MVKNVRTKYALELRKFNKKKTNESSHQIPLTLYILSTQKNSESFIKNMTSFNY
jgi:hypothetical protein